MRSEAGLMAAMRSIAACTVCRTNSTDGVRGRFAPESVPAFAETGAIGATEGEALATPAQDAIAKLWSRILNIGQPGAADDFFALGGNSLKAAQLQLELHSMFGVEMALHQILEHSTIERLASAIAERGGAELEGRR